MATLQLHSSFKLIHIHFFRFNYQNIQTPSSRPGLVALLTWQLSGGDGVGVQLVGVQQPHQSFGGSGLVVIVGEVLPLDGEVRDEH